MKHFYFYSLLFLIFLDAGCRKDNVTVTGNYSCNDLKTVDSWTTINFKTDYSIQVPPEYKGGGMMGFEGNTFFKFSGDTSIIFEYGYCNALFCFDFGDTLQNPVRATVKVKDNSNNLYTLDKILKFCQNSEPIGLLYYSDDNTVNSKLYWNARLYWKDNGLFKQAMMIKFPESDLETVKEIIGTIRIKIRNSHHDARELYKFLNQNLYGLII